MVARHFMEQDELVKYLQKDSDFSQSEAKALYQEVQGKDQNPPKRGPLRVTRRGRVLEWQSKQDFPICPNADDPDARNIYHDLHFPDHG
jgi:hypothetical protein